MLTKEQIANLSTEQQEVLATIELRRVHNRQALLDEIRGKSKPWYRAWKLVASWLLLFCGIYCGLEAIKHSAANIMLALAAITIINFAAVAYSSPVSRRLNALIELMEIEGILEAVPKRPPEADNQRSSKCSNDSPIV